MESKKIYTNEAPKAIGPYSQAILVNGTLYTSGQIGIDPNTGNLVEGIKAQTHQVIKNLIEVLKAEEMDLTNVVKTTVFVKNIGNFGTINEIYATYFTSCPARSLVEVSALPKGAEIEIECIAYK